MKNTFTLFVCLTVLLLSGTTLSAQKNLLPKYEFWIKSGINKNSNLDRKGYSVGVEANTTLYRKFGIGLGLQAGNHKGNSYDYGSKEQIPFSIADLHVHYTAFKGHLRLTTGFCHFYFPTNTRSIFLSKEYPLIDSYYPYNYGYYSLNKSNFYGPSIGTEFRIALPKNCLLSVGLKGQFFTTRDIYFDEKYQNSVLTMNIGLGFGK